MDGGVTASDSELEKMLGEKICAVQEQAVVHRFSIWCVVRPLELELLLYSSTRVEQYDAFTLFGNHTLYLMWQRSFGVRGSWRICARTYRLQQG